MMNGNTPDIMDTASHLPGRDDATSADAEHPIPASRITLACDFIKGYEELHIGSTEQELQHILPAIDDIDDREYQLSKNPLVIPTQENQTYVTPRRTPFLNGWFDTLTSTGNLRFDDYCTYHNHPATDLQHVKTRLQALLNAQSGQDQKALRLSHPDLRFGLAAIPEVVLFLNLPLYMFCRKTQPSQSRTIIQMFKFFCQIVTHPNEELKRCISRDTRSFAPTDTVVQFASKLHFRHAHQLAHLETLLTCFHTTITQSVSIQAFLSILECLIEIRQVTLYECLLAVKQADMTAEQTCPRQISISLDKESYRMDLYRRLGRIRNSMEEFCFKNMKSLRFLVRGYLTLQSSVPRDLLTQSVITGFPKRRLAPEYPGSPKKSSRSCDSEMTSSHRIKNQANLTSYVEHLRLLKKVYLVIPRTEVRLRRFQTALVNFYTEVTECGWKSAAAAHSYFASLLRRAPEDLLMFFKNQRYLRINSLPTLDLVYQNLYRIVWSLHSEAQKRLTNLQVIKQTRAERLLVRSQSYCIFCRDNSHGSESCTSTLHPLVKRIVLRDAGFCFKCLQKMQKGHKCQIICSLCTGAGHHRQVCLKKVPPVKLKTRSAHVKKKAQPGEAEENALS